jgi:hypothetical protein
MQVLEFPLENHGRSVDLAEGLGSDGRALGPYRRSNGHEEAVDP